jgi:hypothetical protein
MGKGAWEGTGVPGNGGQSVSGPGPPVSQEPFSRAALAPHLASVGNYSRPRWRSHSYSGSLRSETTLQSVRLRSPMLG